MFEFIPFPLQLLLHVLFLYILLYNTFTMVTLCHLILLEVKHFFMLKWDKWRWWFRVWHIYLCWLHILFLLQINHIPLLIALAKLTDQSCCTSSLKETKGVKLKKVEKRLVILWKATWWPTSKNEKMK